MNTERVIDALIEWMRNEVESAGKGGVVFGLSGGVDSAVTAYLAHRAFGKEALGIMIPIESDPKDLEDAMLVVEDLDLTHKIVDLEESFHAFLHATGEEVDKWAASNVKARMRMVTLYYFAQKRDMLVVGSSNKSEFMTGYFTKYGDSASDILPLASLYKTEIYELAEALGVPEKIRTKSPSAGLFEGQTDEKDLGITYAELDGYLLTGKGEDRVRDRVETLKRNSAHKRIFAPIFDATNLR